MPTRLVLPLLFCQLCFFVYFTSHLSISAAEANLFFQHNDIAGQLAFLFSMIFGISDLAVRMPFIILYASSVIILFELSKKIISRDLDRTIAIIIFMVLPGVNIAALIINKAIVIIFFTSLFLLCLQKKYTYLSFALLFIYSILDNAFSTLFLSMIFYAIKTDNKKMLIINIVLFAVNMMLFGFDDGGKPKSMFLDTFGVYMAIFSPLAFVYFLFSLFKSMRSNTTEPIVFISFWALIFSMIISIRQKVQFEDFAPFVVISVLFMVPIFFNSYRVRLRPFRKNYKLGGYLILASVLISFISIFSSKLLYQALPNPTKNFAFNYHIAKDLAQELKKNSIKAVNCENEDLQIRLKFYGIGFDQQNVLSKTDKNGGIKVSIVYTGINVSTFYVTKIHTY